MNDRDLIQLLKKKPSEGLYEAILKYNRLVRGVVRRVLPSHPEDVEECVEDAFVNIWRNIDRIDPDTDTLKAYLLSTARNLAISRYRQLKRNRAASLETVPEPAEDDIADAILGEEAGKELQKLVVEMGEPDRGIFFRRFFLFESQKQIAEALKLSEVQVKNKLYRGKLWLRKKLEERGISYEA